MMKFKPTFMRRSRRRGKNSSGFSLIEALILMGLITVGVAAVVYLIAISDNMSMETKDTMNAYQAANEYMEYLRQKPFEALDIQTDATWGASASDMGYNALSKLVNAQGLYTVETYQSSSTMKRVTVKVNWSRKTQAARDRSIALATIITEKGLNERWAE
jgi:Tfp pilus assembly protein PilV